MKFTFRAGKKLQEQKKKKLRLLDPALWEQTRQALVRFWRWTKAELIYLWNWLCHFAHEVTELQPTKAMLGFSLAMIFVLCCVVSLPHASALLEAKQVTLRLGEEEMQLTTKAETVAELMENMGLSLAEGDVIAPKLSHPLQDGDVVALRNAIQVWIHADGQSKQVNMLAGSVEQALYLAGITLGEYDQVVPSLDTPVSAQMNIEVYRIQVHMETEEQGIPYQDVYVEESSLYVGETEVSRQGSEGIRELQIRVVVQDGVEVERSVVGESILEPAVDRIIYKGTKQKPTATPKPSATKKPSSTSSSGSSGSSGSSKPSVSQGPTGNYSEDEVYMAAQLAYLEAKGTGSEGYKAVVNVLINRCNSSSFGGSIETEIFRSGQFSVAKDKESFLSTTPDSKSLAAAEAVLNDGERLLPSSVLYFRAARLGKEWGKRTYYATIGANSFFK